MGLLGNKPWIKLGALAAIAGAVAIAWQVDAQTRTTSSTHSGSGGAPAGSAQRAPAKAAPASAAEQAAPAVAYQGPV